MEMLSTLGVDWRLLLAQGLNFAILLVVLTVLVYRPVLRLIDQRRERIQKSLADVDRVAKQVKEMERDRTQKMKQLDREIQDLLGNAREQAEKSRQQTMANAQQEVDNMMERTRKQLEEERDSMLRDVQRTVLNAGLALSEKILEREFTAKDQERLMKSLEKDIPSLIR